MANRRRALFVLRHPAQYVVAAFLGASLAGSLLLLLPVASEQSGSVPFVTAWFTATSAVCVTGLVVLDTATQWTTFGELVILGLIQIGGLGIMTLSSLLVVVVSRRLGLRQRMIAAAESSLDVGDVRRLLVGVLRFTLISETVVIVALFLRFWLAYDESVTRSFYLAVFHAISAFNNAGFALWSDSLIGFQQDPVLLLILALAIVVGGLGYPVWRQVLRNPRRPRRWNLHAKITVSTTAGLLAAGTAAFAWFEWTNRQTLGQLSAFDSAVNAFFHAVTPRTAGFNSLDITALREPTRLLTETLMFIGGGSASTAGGIKVTTFAVLGWVMWAEVRGDPEVVAFDRRLPTAVQRQALSVALLAIGLVIGATMLLLATSPFSRDDLLFEAVSAFATVGLSANLTPLLSTVPQLILIGLMLIGRVGPITLFAALVLRQQDRRYHHPEERPIVG